jgi:hypothetical protein
MLDLQALLGQMTQSSAERKANIEGQIQASNAAIEQDAQRQAGLIEVGRGIAADSAKVAAQAAEIEFARTLVGENAQRVVNLDPDNVNNALAQSLATYTAAEDARKAERAKYDQLNSVDFFQNPIGHIFAQLQLPQVARQHNAAADARDSAQADLLNRTQMLQAHKSSVSANVSQSIKDVKLAEAQIQQRAAELQLKEAEAENAGKLAARKLQLFQLTDKLFDVDSDLISKKLQIGQYMMSLQERQEARAERAAAARERAARAADDAEVDAALNMQLARVSRAMGLTTPMTLTSLRRMPDKKRAQAWLDAAYTGQFGGSLAESIGFIEAQGNPTALAQSNPGLSYASQALGTGLQSYLTIVDRQAKATGETIKPADAIAKAEELYQDVMVSGASRPGTGNSLTSSRWDSVFTPYRAQHRVMVELANSGDPEVGRLKDNLMTKQLGAALQAAPDKTSAYLPSDMERAAIMSVADLVRQKKVSPELAAQQIADFYQTSAMKNIDTFNYTLMGLPAQTRYMALLQPAGVFRQPIEVDLMSETAVKNALMKMVVSARGGNTNYLTGNPMLIDLNQYEPK